MRKKLAVDYVILGAGSAGSVITNRILKKGKPGVSVALIEAGKLDFGNINSWQIQMPAALTYSVGSNEYNWDFHSTKQPTMNNRKLHAPRGKVLGGSSSINAMVYIRGHALDFERWQKEGAPGWGYSQVLPYFKRLQSHIFQTTSIVNKVTEFRGTSGDLKTTSLATGNRNNELFDVFEKGGEEVGYKITTDVNGYRQEGFGPFDMTVDAKSGVRCSASRAFLHPLLSQMELVKNSLIGKNSYQKDKLSLFTRTVAKKILFSNESSGKPRAVGVECEDISTGEIYEIEAKQEVIVSLGAVGSPQLLTVSGIGNKADLERIGVDQVVHNEFVGKNLQDHLEIYLQYLSPKQCSIYPFADWDFSNPLHVLKRVAIGIQWFLTGKGVCASNLFESGSFIRSRAGIEHPDIQMHFIPAIIHGQLDVLKKHGFQIHSGTLRPTSRGSINVVSNDVKDAPQINPNYLSTQKDIEDMRAAVRLANEIVSAPVFKEYVGEKFGEFKEVDLANDDQLDEWIRSFAESAYHLSCSCAMGKVVDENGKVFGADSLRIVDASIMPSMTSGNLNAPTMMIAEKISDDILGLPAPEPEEIEYFVHPEFEENQR